MARGQVDLGLEMQRELLLVQRAPQRAFQRQPVECLRIHVRRVELHRIAPVRLGAVHRDFGMLDQCVGVGPVGRPGRHAGAAAEHQMLVAELQRFGHRIAHLSNARGSLAFIAAAAQHHHEVVAADTRRRVERGQRALDACGQQPQRRVAGSTAQRIVDQLEVVDVEQHDPHRHAGRGGGSCALDAVGQQRAVGQARQCIVTGVALEFGFITFSGGDIVDGHDEMADLAVRTAHGRDVDIGDQFGAVARVHRHESVFFALLAQRRAQYLHRWLIDVRAEQERERLAGQFLRRVAEGALASRIGVADRVTRCTRIDQQDRIGAGRHRPLVHAQ